MSAYRYVGKLTAVRVNGRKVRVKPVAIGAPVKGFGVVTADTKEDLLAGAIHLPFKGVPFVRADATYYRRRRPGYASNYWVHPMDCDVQVTPAGDVYVTSPQTGICNWPPGDFLCEFPQRGRH